jgi:L-malate glycosyltransferase
MRIAFVSFMRAFPWGGSEELWATTAKLALADGHIVCTLTQRWDTVPKKIAELRQLGADTQVYDKATYSLAERLAIKLGLQQRITDVVPPVEADVYVFSNGSTWDMVAHHAMLKTLTARHQPYILINQHSFENGHVVAGAQRAAAIEVVDRAAAVLFVAEANWRASERQLAHRMTRALVVSNPVNITKRGIRPYPTSAKLLLACVARLDCDFKGQDLLLQVLSTACWASRDFTLKLYGTGPHQEHLRHLVKVYDLGNKVSIEGHVSDIDRVWETSQALVLPSISEGTPLSLVECMLSGRAAVATDVGDNARYVRDGETGFLANAASVRCLSESMEKLWNHRDELEALGKAAYAHAAAITDFSPEVQVLACITDAAQSVRA